MKYFKLVAWVFAALSLAGSPLHAAKVILKITKWSSDGILTQYSNNPGTYPVTQEKLSCIAFGGTPDDCVRSNGTCIFDTTIGAMTVGTGNSPLNKGGSGGGGGGDGARTGRLVVSSGSDLLKTGGAGGLGQITISSLELPNLSTHREDWRMVHFGTTANTGMAADNFDANSDGESNLLEFATGQNPLANTLLSTSLEMNGNAVEYRYPRSLGAMADGMSYQVVWSDSLLGGSRSTIGLIDSLDTANPGNAEVENRMATVPLSATGKRSIRLQITP